MKKPMKPRNIKAPFEYLYGHNSVFEALQSDRRKHVSLYIAKDKKGVRFDGVIQSAEILGINIRHENLIELDSLAGSKQHQGVVLKTGSFPFSNLSEVLSVSECPLLLIPDCIEDPRNLGAIIRTAHCAGVDGIIIPKDRSAGPSPLVSKTSAGALEHSKLVQVTNIVKTMKELKKSGIWFGGLDAEGSSSVYSMDLSVPLGIVIGGEGKGIRPLVLKNCDFTLSIPQKGKIDSLNASVAASIVVYEALRQRDNLT